jgi:hypothetical protein
MRTEEDLRSLFAAREDLAPDQHQVLEGARQAVARRRRRRSAGAAAAAAAVVAVALPVTVRGLSAAPGADATPPEASVPVAGATSSTPAARVPSGPRPPFAFTILPGSAAGYEIRPVAVNPDLQIAAIRGRGKAQIELLVYRPGAESRAMNGWDVTEDPVRVAVDRTPALYSARDGASAIRWEYAPGGWAVISATSSPVVPKETLIALAEAVRFSAPYPAKVPYRLSYLPAGFKPFHFTWGAEGAGAPRPVVQFEDGAGHQGVMDIAIHDGAAGSRPEWRADRTMAGRPADCTDLVDGRRCAVDFGSFTVDVGTGGLTDAVLERVVAGMRFADWDDPATWYDLDTAMPGR